MLQLNTAVIARSISIISHFVIPLAFPDDQGTKHNATCYPLCGRNIEIKTLLKICIFVSNSLTITPLTFLSSFLFIYFHQKCELHSPSTRLPGIRRSLLAKFASHKTYATSSHRRLQSASDSQSPETRYSTSFSHNKNFNPTPFRLLKVTKKNLLVSVCLCVRPWYPSMSCFALQRWHHLISLLFFLLCGKMIATLGTYQPLCGGNGRALNPLGKGPWFWFLIIPLASGLRCIL